MSLRAFYLSLFLLTTILHGFTQDTSKIVAVYKLVFQPDSTDAKSRRTEDMMLYISDSSSVFKSKNQNILDSIDQIPLDRMDVNKALHFSFSVGTAFSFSIIKTDRGKIHYRDMIDVKKYQYNESKDVFAWELLKDTMTINSFFCRKASTVYAGREWTCWFTEEVPISDGPYKFCGLPGLIVHVYDKDNFFEFTLQSLEIKKLSIFHGPKRATTLTKEKYYASLKYFLDNQMEIAALRGEKIYRNEDAIRQRLQERRKKNNNYFERIIDLPGKVE